MDVGLRNAGLGALALLAVGGAARAGEVDVAVQAGRHFYERSGFGDDCARRRYIRAPDPGECRVGSYGRPWRNRLHWRSHGWPYPAAAWPSGRDLDDCRIVVTRRANPWGDLIVKHTKICG